MVVIPSHHDGLYTPMTHDTPTYTPPLPASSSSPTVVSGICTFKSLGTSRSGTDVPGPEESFEGGSPVCAAEHRSSTNDSPSRNVPDGVSTDVNSPGGNAARGEAASPCIRHGSSRGCAAEGRRRREMCQCVSFESTVVEQWAKRLRWSVMRDIIVTVRLWCV